MRPVITALSVLLVAFSTLAAAQDERQFTYTVVFEDQQGVTHFREEQLRWQTSQTTQLGNMPALLTPYLDAQKIGFVRLHAGYDADWHPAPSKRFVIVLSGTGEIEVGDGERRALAAGGVVLVTDTQGRGHRTSAVGNQDVLIAWVPVP